MKPAIIEDNIFEFEPFEEDGQTNRILLNMTSDYNPRALAKDIKHYFERNDNALEVLIMKGKRTISVIREDTLGKSFVRNFMMKYRYK